MAKKTLVIGILAHVDAGKTTLSEGLLYQAGAIRTLGRVDHKDAYLDTNAMERERGITIFSKQARFSYQDMDVTLLDTPGHVDFSAEMERTLPLLDYAILVISGADGVQAHTKTLWRLLRRYHVPVFIFVNKMDQPGTNREQLLENLKEYISDRCVDFTDACSNEKVSDERKSADSHSQNENAKQVFLENVAVCSEEAMEQYLSKDDIDISLQVDMIKKREMFPCLFGSALKLEGVTELLEAMDGYMKEASYDSAFAGRAYKISRDDKGSRLTFLKVTGGVLHVKDLLEEEKVNQLRLYNGDKYELVKEVQAGMVCAVTGPANTFAGQGLGAEKTTYAPMLQPVLNYRLVLPEETDIHKTYQQLQEIEEEEPLLHLVYEPQYNEIRAQVMGEIQCEILKRLVLERYGFDISFENGNIVYKETIGNCVEGVGHFEPLKHYAEVHLLMEPGLPGSGIQIETAVKEDDLDRNWQRLIATHVLEKKHKGVLTGAELTDVKITLVAGRAHKKHTEGGDFRQATYRAVRQGLMQAENVLLEPVYAFTLTVPSDKVGRAISDIQNASGRFDTPKVIGDTTEIQGAAPVSEMRDYAKTVMEYTKGEGQFTCRLMGYEPCHNTEEVVEAAGYDAARDVENTADSVFCSHGAGYVVSWDEVKNHMHVQSGLLFSDDSVDEADSISTSHRQIGSSAEDEMTIDESELEEIFRRTFGANQNSKKKYQKSKVRIYSPTRSYKRPVFKDKYLLVDGYNIIFAWDNLKMLGPDNLDGARNRLMDIMCNYQAYKKMKLILVFDAYKVKNNPGEIFDYHNIHVVYTKEAQTADAYIEKFTHENASKYDITVATSDGLEQMIVIGRGARRMSARELYEDIEHMEEELRTLYLNKEWE